MEQHKNVREVDALIVGAGMGGIHTLRKLTAELGLDALVIDRATGIGGTWHWNRYPGVRSDTESPMYQLPFEVDLYKTTKWRRRYLMGTEIREYLEHAVDMWGLRDRIELDTAMIEARFDEDSGTWTVTTSRDTFRARFLVTALGVLSRKNLPDLPGIDQFRGRVLHTAAWPEDLDLTGKRIGVIGNGSTGVQFMAEAAKTVGHLTSFQRTPQYTVPAGDREYSEAELEQFRGDPEAIWERWTEETVGFGLNETDRLFADSTPNEREEIFEAAWKHGGGFAFQKETFADLTSDRDANDAAADFIKRKITSIVQDPETARKLTPTEVYARRPICDSGYYEIFNQDNVELVSLRENPIERFTEAGIVTADGVEHELDLLVLATGFDSNDGSYRGVSIVGRDGKRLLDHWGHQPKSLFGTAVHGFPNMFMIFGPLSPFINNPVGIGLHARWVATTIKALGMQPGSTIEATAEAEADWVQACLTAMEGALFLETESWLSGGNVPGKRTGNIAYWYTPGLKEYLQIERNEVERGFPSFEVHVPSDALQS